MKTNIWLDKLIDEYYVFLRSKTDVITHTGTDWSVISTPYIDAFNDTVELYIKKDGNKILLSDDGVTLNNLELTGIVMSRSVKRRAVLDKILFNYGLHLNGNEITTEATEQDFAQKKFSFISAISEINDMHMLANHSVSSIFMEDVQGYLEEQNIIFTPSFIAKGSSGLEFNFDFQIAGHSKEIVIKSFNNLNESNLTSFLFKWEDIKPAREKISNKEMTALALINNNDKNIQDRYLEALTNKGANFMLWTDRHTPENISKLKAA